MSTYSVVLVAHVLGAVGMFCALALEASSLGGLRRASTEEQARAAFEAHAVVPWVGAPALLVTLASGIYLAIQWQWEPWWMRIGFASILLMPLLGGAISGRRQAALKKAFSPEGARDPLLILSLRVRFATLIGIVFLMEAKPPLTGSLLCMGVAVLAGLAASLPAWLRPRLESASRSA